MILRRRVFSGREEEVLGQLLGDRRAALPHVVGAGIFDQGAERTHDVDTEMLIEAGIFGGENGVDHVRRDLLQRYGVVLAYAAPADDFP